MISWPKDKPAVSLLISDVDGTLVTPDKVVTAQTRSAISRLRAAGIAFSIASSRPTLGLKQLISDLKIDIPLGALDGSVIIRPDLGVISSRRLPKHVVMRALKLFRENHLAAWLYTETDWYVLDSRGPQVERESWVMQFSPKVRTNFDPLLDRTVKVVGVSSNPNLDAAFPSMIRNVLPTIVSVAQSDADSLDVTHRLATKGRVVDFLSRHLRIPRQAIATIGDMPSDVLMFERSGMSIAMGNAGSDVQARATLVTRSNDKDGFSHAIENFIKPETLALT